MGGRPQIACVIDAAGRLPVLGVGQAPDLVGLNAFGLHIPHVGVMVGGAGI